MIKKLCEQGSWYPLKRELGFAGEFKGHRCPCHLFELMSDPVLVTGFIKAGPHAGFSCKAEYGVDQNDQQ